nr:hypothetical protein CFP56_10994 [Quercus suber]
MVRLRSAVRASPIPPRVQRQTRQALKEKTNTAGTKPRLHVYENDGDTEELVKNVRARRTVEQKLSHEGGMLMTGGLGMLENQQMDAVVEELPDSVEGPARHGKLEQENAKSYRRPSRVTKTPASGMAQSRTREALKKRVADLSKGAEPPATKVRTSNAKVSQSPELPQHEAPSTVPTRHSASGLELSEMSLSLSSPFSDGLNSVRDGNSLLKRPGSVLRPRNTPAAEASVLVLKHFKQRPRQPSMLQLVQQHATNAALPAPQAASPNDASAYDLALDDEHDEVEDDFQPDAEGTPLLMRQSKQKALRSSGRYSPSRYGELSDQGSSKRKAAAIEQSAALYATRKDKRQGSNLEEIGDEPVDELSLVSPGSLSTTRDHGSPQSRTRSVVQVTNSSPLLAPLSEPPSPRDRQVHGDVDVAIPSTEEQHHDFELDTQHRLGARPGKDAYEAPNGTMAEPASSSPPPEEPPELDVGTKQPVSRNARLMGKTGQNPSAKSKSKPLSSAALQSLLPKRRQRPKPQAKPSEYDIADSDDDPALEDSELSPDEDELSIRPRRRRTRVTSAKNRPSTTIKDRSRPSTTAATAKRKTAAAASRRPATTSKKPVKTYGRISDIENDNYEVADEEQEDDSSALPEISMYEATKSKELEDMKRKFAEIDALDMEFETVDQDEHRSSSSQWR